MELYYHLPSNFILDEPILLIRRTMAPLAYMYWTSIPFGVKTTSATLFTVEACRMVVMLTDFIFYSACWFVSKKGGGSISAPERQRRKVMDSSR